MSAHPLVTSAALVLATLSLAVAGCDTNTDEEGGGPTTVCDFSYAQTNPAGKGFGQACTSDADCVYGECLMPGDAGNIENAQFGFCTRGCNCGDDAAAQLSAADKETLTCLDPSGFSGKKRHVVLTCADVTTCTTVDPGWTSCALPTTGGARRICQAP